MQLRVELLTELMATGDQFVVQRCRLVGAMQRIDTGAQLLQWVLAMLDQPQRHFTVTNQLPVSSAQQQALERIALVGGFQHQIRLARLYLAQHVAVQALAPDGGGLDLHTLRAQRRRQLFQIGGVMLKQRLARFFQRVRLEQHAAIQRRDVVADHQAEAGLSIMLKQLRCTLQGGLLLLAGSVDDDQNVANIHTADSCCPRLWFGNVQPSEACRVLH